MVVKDFVDERSIVRYYNRATERKGQMLFIDSMASFVKLDSTNLVQDGYNSTWKYSFPGSAADFKDVTCAVQSISMYNSEYNVDSLQFLNNSFKVEVPTAATASTITFRLLW
ncbi:uncharacterized protein PITG_16148 [Phytophthora infestans T30-4]|uniref:Uncharacterized protein n=1 Tax=Phytophthora infestans (strain T30-4) TaxID=403677 RepID=D0NT01_PHYIT|nr:uncharacterized protein PITG_16148 [Phytophthora infestans T30-4]EEY64713.1 conserved hypothetical protein [Phytophthora infestans T30-4]|eukprot:XP_002897913.1 conserved hypothetical protein [Phytophthora infestans T30-4]